MSAPQPAATALEFIVLGAQKAGTTTLWRLLRGHPELWVPETKEEPYLSRARLMRRGLEAHLERLHAPAERTRVRGKVTPEYLRGTPDATTAQVAATIAARLPDVRVVLLFRDPVERARSHHTMNLRRGWETRSFEAAIAASLGPEGLAGRSRAARPDQHVRRAGRVRPAPRRAARTPPP